MVCKVFVVGMGMGNAGTLTLAARDALAQSELIMGSQRLLDQLDAYSVRKVPLVVSEKIAQELRTTRARVASVVMSGDVGFYSGATKLYGLLETIGAEVEVIPGISSLSYLCAKLRVPWQDAFVVSAHGRAHDACGDIQSHTKTFVLLGGDLAPGELCAQLVRRGLEEVRVVVGERLSYADERIVTGTAAELANRSFDRLCVLLAQNDRPMAPQVAAPHMADDSFARGAVPMTKEEVRELAICKLCIEPAHVVWDVGAGTGSVSVEAARAAYAGQVFSVEKSAEALELVEQNKKRFGLSNLHVVAGEAPDAFAGLPAPNRVFVGGSSGRLDGILRAALYANPAVRLCVAAVTLETLSCALACVKELGLEDVDIAQVSISKARGVGAYHLMQAHNSVYLISASHVCGG